MKIAATDLDLRFQDGKWADTLDIFVVQRNDAERNAKVTGLTLSLHLKPETYQKGIKEGISFDQPLDSKPDTGVVRIVVVDKNSGRMGSVTIPSEGLTNRAQPAMSVPFNGQRY